MHTDDTVVDTVVGYLGIPGWVLDDLVRYQHADYDSANYDRLCQARMIYTKYHKLGRACAPEMRGFSILQKKKHMKSTCVPSVWCMPGFYPGSQSPNKKVIGVKAPKMHPRFAYALLDGANPHAVLYKLTERMHVLERMPTIVTDRYGNEYAEMHLKVLPHMLVDTDMLHEQLEDVEIGKGATYAVITFTASHTSVRGR